MEISNRIVTGDLGQHSAGGMVWTSGVSLCQ